jgi:hypothetical protein
MIHLHGLARTADAINYSYLVDSCIGQLPRSESDEMGRAARACPVAPYVF